MSDYSPLPPVESTGAEPGYRPISLLAIAGLFVSSLFALVVLLTGIVSLFSGKSALLSVWILVFAVAGGLMSLAAQIQIRRSEGTRAGLGLATIGLWLSIVFGLGFAVVALTTYLTIRSQAAHFLENEFLSLLRIPGKLDEAFLLTQLPEVRAEVNPENEAELEQKFPHVREAFNLIPVIRLIHQGGPEVKFHNAGVRDIFFAEGGYQVAIDMNIETPEAKVLILFLVRSQDTAQGRKWYVNVAPPPRPREGNLTSQGISLLNLRKDSHRAAERWIQAWVEKNHDKLRKGSCQPDDFKPDGKGLQLDRVVDENRRRAIRDLFDFAKARSSHFRADFLCNETKNQSLGFDLLPYWEIKDKRLQVAHLIRFPVFDKDKTDLEKFVCMANLIVERTDGGDPISWEPRDRPAWCVRRLEITRIDILGSVPPKERRKPSRD